MGCILVQLARDGVALFRGRTESEQLTQVLESVLDGSFVEEDGDEEGEDGQPTQQQLRGRINRVSRLLETLSFL